MQHRTAVLLSSLLVTAGIVGGASALSEPPSAGLVTSEQPTPAPERTPSMGLLPTPTPEPTVKEVDCYAVLDGPDDGSDVWLDCYTWFVETSETQEEQEEAQALTERVTQGRVYEEDPDFDCRTDGNETCGVQIEGDWYNVTFSDGQPVSITQQ